MAGEESDEISARTDHVILCVGAAAVAGFVFFPQPKGPQAIRAYVSTLTSDAEDKCTCMHMHE